MQGFVDQLKAQKQQRLVTRCWKQKIAAGEIEDK